MPNDQLLAQILLRQPGNFALLLHCSMAKLSEIVYSSKGPELAAVAPQQAFTNTFTNSVVNQVPKTKGAEDPWSWTPSPLC